MIAEGLIAKIIIRFIIGGLSVVAVSLLSELKHPILGGIFYSFPAMALVALTSIFISSGAPLARELIVSMLITFPIFFIFLGAYFVLSFKFGAIQTTLLSLGVWLSATLLFLGVYKIK